MEGTSPPEGWTIATWVAHSQALRDAELRFDDERDRRYAEVDVEREKALKIKETADLAALGLARDIQIYKDEKANELRSQIERERGDYATRHDLTAAVEKLEAIIKPLTDFRSNRTGHTEGQVDARAALYGILIIAAGMAAAISPHIH